MKKKYNILFLTPRFPFPLIGGDRVKPYNILKYLSQEHNVTLITFYQGNKCPEEYLNELISLGIKVRVIELDPISAGLRAGALTLAGYPLEIGYYYDPKFAIQVEKTLKTESFDFAVSFFMRTAEYLKNKKIPKILMAEDCRIVYQQRSYLESKNFLQRFIRWWEYKKLIKYEPIIIDKFDISTFVTNEDIKAIKMYGVKNKIMLLSNGVNTDLYKLPPNNYERKNILFAGKLDIWANIMMLNLIIEQIMPKIWEKFPNIRLNIVGANPTKSISNIKHKNINLIPNVPSIIPYYQESLIFIHPHSGATGIQNKVLEAMACGCAVVTTQTGIQGINATNNLDVILAGNSEEFANKIIELLNNPNKAVEIGKNASDLVNKFNTWENINKQFDIITNCLLQKTN